jgi:four helix bundle protein
LAAIKKFEELTAWQKARALNTLIYQISEQGRFSKDYALKDQVRRASISIMSNIAEGFERNGNKEFIQFLSIAKASCAELRSQLYIAFDLNYIEKKEFEKISLSAIEVGKIMQGLIEYLKSSELRGSKFAEEEVYYKAFEL